MMSVNTNSLFRSAARPVPVRSPAGAGAARKVVPTLRNGQWGWAVEWAIPGEFPVVTGFYADEATARDAAENTLDRKGRDQPPPGACQLSRT